MTDDQAVLQISSCRYSPARFLHEHCRIEDRVGGEWIPFQLWPAQVAALASLDEPGAQFHLWLKARQLGMSWLALGYILHMMLFYPGSQALLFSRRDNEAMDLLERLKGMYSRLPEWLQANYAGGDAHSFELSNRSRCLAFPSVGGDSYTATLAIVDEADLVPNLDKLLGSVKPTIDAGGKLLLLSRPDKSKSESPFKRLARAAMEGSGPWKFHFFPWSARPSRTPAWYEAQKIDSLSRTDSLDYLYEHYPATAEEALAANTMDKRIPLIWLQRCYKATTPIHRI